jgi:hypothetical protein
VTFLLPTEGIRTVGDLAGVVGHAAAGHRGEHGVELALKAGRTAAFDGVRVDLEALHPGLVDEPEELL